jgi:hypothetical protein
MTYTIKFNSYGDASAQLSEMLGCANLSFEAIIFIFDKSETALSGKFKSKKHAKNCCAAINSRAAFGGTQLYTSCEVIKTRAN